MTEKTIYPVKVDTFLLPLSIELPAPLFGVEETTFMCWRKLTSTNNKITVNVLDDKDMIEANSK